MSNVELTCINCPLGCQLTATVENGAVIKVSGNNCIRGERYAKNEVVAPKRTVTSTVRGVGCRVCVKTVPESPKEKIFACMEEIHKTVITSHVHIGDVIIKNIAGTGSDLVATSEG
ncbi:DUF1667 domain-containing protein [Bullifex porci]|uniref:DUF1667 domain-containing protein n=1 Tax=Bullifex porci TaxID=2606638 RepID=UPI0023F2774B|nr:DUF1667 domain-containing protein [Bullifex porci]MDD7588898.1 DUF1667 domain-containing protein [Bullifex porci]